MRRRVPVLLCVLLAVAVACAGAPVAAQSDGNAADVEQTRLEAQLQADGDARWTITATIPLENDRQVEHFRSFADAFESGQRDFQLGVSAFQRAATAASEASGRQMSITSRERNAVLVNETEGGEVVSQYGKLQVSFTWTSFARVDEDGTIYVDDAFNTTDGTWLNGIDEDQTLIIRSPPGYGGPSTSPIGAEDGDLTWEGPAAFEPGYFTIVYPQPDSSPVFGFSTMLLGGAMMLSGAVLALGMYLVWRRDTGGRKPGPAEGPAGAAEAADAGEFPSPEAPANPGAEPRDAAAEAEAGAGAAADADAEEPDLELLSDEERVEYLLEQNGGRMKQANIVKETGWSNAKVSQLLSSMEEEERIDKLRIGRENLISLPGENVGDIAPEPDDDGGP
jgi:uncharacterized membrane protein